MARSEPLTDPLDRRHGSTGGYTNHGCRCERCASANAASIKRWRQERRQR